jgi:hypothetical protein
MYRRRPPQEGKVFTQKQGSRMGEGESFSTNAFKKEMAPSCVIIVGTGLARQGFRPSSHLSHLTPCQDAGSNLAGDA